MSEQVEEPDFIELADGLGRSLNKKYRELEGRQRELIREARQLERVERAMYEIEKRAEKLVDSGVLTENPLKESSFLGFTSGGLVEFHFIERN